jgi:hypothetical protein
MTEHETETLPTVEEAMKDIRTKPVVPAWPTGWRRTWAVPRGHV